VVVERLLAAGRPPEERVAVVSRAASPGQTVVESTLSGVVDAVADAAIEPPALLVVGGVVDLRRRLEWWQPR
jgi:uroporphyrin-III C-methyltransferase